MVLWLWVYRNTTSWKQYTVLYWHWVRFVGRALWCHLQNIDLIVLKKLCNQSGRMFRVLVCLGNSFVSRPQLSGWFLEMLIFPHNTPFMKPPILWSTPVSPVAKYSHTIVLPPPCFMVYFMLALFSSKCNNSHVVQTVQLVSSDEFPNI